jgi:hypothetical protein
MQRGQAEIGEPAESLLFQNPELEISLAVSKLDCVIEA